MGPETRQIMLGLALLLSAMLPILSVKIPSFRESERGRRGSSWLLVLFGLYLGWVGVVEGTSGLTAGLLSAGMVTCFVSASLPKAETIKGSLPGLGVMLGPCLGALILSGLSTSNENSLLAVQSLRLLMYGGVVLMAFAFALMARAMLRIDSSGVAGPSASMVFVGALALLSFSALCALGGSSTVAHVPVMDESFNGVLLLLDFDKGLPLTIAKAELGGVLAGGGVAALICAFIPAGRLRSIGALLSCLLILGGVFWLLSLHGQAGTVDLEAVKVPLMAAGAPELLVNAPRFSGEAPFMFSVTTVTGPVMMLLTAGMLSLAICLREGAEPSEDVSAALLGGRDAFQLGVLSVWLGLAMVLGYGYRVYGIWGLSRPSEHGWAGVAFVVTACLVLLHGVGGSSRPAAHILRTVSIALAVALLVGSAAGGVVGALGLFSL